MKMTTKILARLWWLGRGTATVMGLAMLLALTVGLASTALAGTGVGARFDLGKTNTVNAISSLVGSVAGPSLKIDNNSAGPSATALDLQVEPGKAPMNVNSSTKVQGLNVDQVDSKSAGDFLQESTDRDDFLPRQTYNTVGILVSVADGQNGTAIARCDPGDTALSGGFNFGLADSSTVFFEATSGNTFSVGFRGPRIATANVTCADFPPLR